MLTRLDRWRKPATGTPSDDLLSSRFANSRRHRDQEQAVEKALRESGGTAPTNANAKATAAGDPTKLRGIPALAPGVSSTQRGTHPEREAIRRDEQRRRTRDRLGDPTD